jgi:hypothetical protein
MKKTPPKLVLRIQTLRVLADIELSRAAGGQNSVDAPCTAVNDTNPRDCPTVQR